MNGYEFCCFGLYLKGEKIRSVDFTLLLSFSSESASDNHGFRNGFAGWVPMLP